jgi:hypothetical protein
VEKEYQVEWQVPGKTDTVNIITDDIAKIPSALFGFFDGRPPGCPFLITKIELVNPEQYLISKAAA